MAGPGRAPEYPGSCAPPRPRVALLFIPLFTPGSVVFRCALALPLGLLIAAWAMPRRRRHIGRRVLYASLAPASVFVLYMSCARPMPNP